MTKKGLQDVDGFTGPLSHCAGCLAGCEASPPGCQSWQSVMF